MGLAKESGYQGDSCSMKRYCHICMNDDKAQVYDYLYEHGMKAGEDISIAGYDNMEISNT